MPRPKPERQVLHERHLAQRIRELREARDWTLDRLAQKMTDAGCPMDRSAIHRIEQGKPPRRITVDEAVTFAGVFGLSLPAMILPPSIAKSQEAIKLFRRYEVVSERYVDAGTEMQKIQDQLVEIADEGFETEVLEALAGVVSPDSAITPNDVVDQWRLIKWGRDHMRAGRRASEESGGES